LVPLAQIVNAKAVDGISENDIDITRRTLLVMIQNLADDEARALEAGLRITATRDLAVKNESGAETESDSGSGPE
jgi:hypothetical protein